MIKPVGDNILILDDLGNTIQTFTRIKGIGTAERYDATGEFNALNLSINDVEAVKVRHTKRIAMERARA